MNEASSWAKSNRVYWTDFRTESQSIFLAVLVQSAFRLICELLLAVLDKWELLKRIEHVKKPGRLPKDAADDNWHPKHERLNPESNP